MLNRTLSYFASVSSMFYVQSDRPGGLSVPADGPLDGHAKTSELKSWNDSGVQATGY